MCLAIPMQIRSVDGYTACCEANGINRDVSLFMLQDNEAGVGDYVVGYAIEKITPEEAIISTQYYGSNGMDGPYIGVVMRHNGQ